MRIFCLQELLMLQGGGSGGLVGLLPVLIIVAMTLLVPAFVGAPTILCWSSCCCSGTNPPCNSRHCCELITLLDE